MINYAVPEQCQITISLYNILGREVDRLYAGYQVPGYHSITWDAFEYSSGVYFVKMLAGEYINILKLILIKQPASPHPLANITTYTKAKTV